MMKVQTIGMAALVLMLFTDAGNAQSQGFSSKERAIGITRFTWAFMTAWNLSNNDFQVSRNWYSGTETWTFQQPHHQNWIAKFIYHKDAGQTRELQWSYTQVFIQ
jgi:hypothetical protein